MSLAQTPNTLVVIGWMGTKRAYLNVPKEEAQKRWMHEEGWSAEEIERDGYTLDEITQEFSFGDHFGVYEAWSSE